VGASGLETSRAPWRAPRDVHPSPAAIRCRARFLRFFPQGFRDETYLDWERGYKWAAHEQWNAALAPALFRELLTQGRFTEIATEAVRIESRTNLLFSFEKMALRDAIRTPRAAEAFATGLFDYLSAEPEEEAFERWVETVASLPRRQTRVLTWPVATVFGFLARPDRHIFLKPMVTQAAARAYRFDFAYRSRPSWETYSSLLEFAALVRRDIRDLAPADMIDLQSFIWVQGSDEYEE
jgi:hypothetical protein